MTREGVAATGRSIGLDRLWDVREWIQTGMAATLDQPSGEFLLGIESVSIIDALDYIEGYILNLEQELGR